MGIDGIGKRGGVGSTGDVGLTTPNKVGEGFASHEPGAAKPTEAVRGSNALEELEAGRLDLDGYLDHKVNAATAHLEGLPPADLTELRSLLREQIASDPGFADLVEQATGKRPAAEGE